MPPLRQLKIPEVGAAVVRAEYGKGSIGSCCVFGMLYLRVGRQQGAQIYRLSPQAEGGILQIQRSFSQVSPGAGNS